MATTTDNKRDTIIEVKNVTKVFDGVTVVDDMNLAIKRGEFVTLLGPSGCGKTTLLRMIAGFETPTDGQIYVERTNVTEVPPYKRSINTVFQKYALFPHLNVYKNVAFGLKLKRIVVDAVDKQGKPILDKEGKQAKKTIKLTKQQIDDKVKYGLKMVGLDGYGGRDVSSLSGGQQQRVAIARALVCEPKVLLLDEPLGALDLKMRKEMQVELMRMHKELGITFVYVTHDQEEALTMSDTIVVIRDGVIQQVGTPKKIYDEPKNQYVADFIGESNILSGTMVADFRVQVEDKILPCSDKGFEKNEKVDLVIRPEDIEILPIEKAEVTALQGVVQISVFKGTYYEMEIKVGGYEFTVQNTVEQKIGSTVALKIDPNNIHIMKKDRVINEYKSEVIDEGVVEICGGNFECDTAGFEIGQEVIASFDFLATTLVDHEDNGTIGGFVANSLYKGKYYQVQVYTDDDQDIFVDTPDEWDIGDRIGITIKKDAIKLRLPDPQKDTHTGHPAEEAQSAPSSDEGEVAKQATNQPQDALAVSEDEI
ncbi:MAG: ABC transporter ATP-binding protein [Firmicutes bacterium]|nr:ABC transporter ATP-binding protein [Bacillota bacterium]